MRTFGASYLQDFQLGQSLDGLFVKARDLVVVQLETSQRGGTLEGALWDCCEGIVRQVSAMIGAGLVDC